MSMVIIGENPPKNCYVCSWYNKVQCPVNDGRYYYRVQRHPDCPLIELPPHGRLGDLDELIDGCEKLMHMLDPEGKEYLRVFAIKSYLMWAAEYAIIEAEGKNI